MDPRCAHGFQILLRPPARTCQASPRTFLNTSFWRPLPRPGCTFTVQIRSCCTQFSGTSQGCREALESRPSRTLHSLVFGEEHGAEPCHGESAASVTSFEELASPETGLSALTYSTLTPEPLPPETRPPPAGMPQASKLTIHPQVTEQAGTRTHQLPGRRNVNHAVHHARLSTVHPQEGMGPEGTAVDPNSPTRNSVRSFHLYPVLG